MLLKRRKNGVKNENQKREKREDVSKNMTEGKWSVECVCVDGICGYTRVYDPNGKCYTPVQIESTCVYWKSKNVSIKYAGDSTTASFSDEGELLEFANSALPRQKMIVTDISQQIYNTDDGLFELRREHGYTNIRFPKEIVCHGWNNMDKNVENMWFACPCTDTKLYFVHKQTYKDFMALVGAKPVGVEEPGKSPRHKVE